MKIKISQCWCVAFAVLAACGCSSENNEAAIKANEAANAAEGKAPGAMTPAEQQAEIAKRMDAAQNRDASGAGAAAAGHPMTVEGYKTIMNHMNAQQKIEYARKHPDIGSQLPPPAAPPQ